MIENKAPWIILFLSFCLSGCLKVEDSNNEEEIAALNSQTEALQEQNQILQQQLERDTKVTVFGAVEIIGLFEPLQAGTVTATLGSSARDPVEIVNGTFEIPDLPAGTDFELLVEGVGDVQARAFYSRTTTSSSEISYQDLGVLSVSKLSQRTFTVTDSSTDSVIPNLQFWYETHVGSSAKAINRRFVSNFDSATGTYTIDVPDDLSFTLRANIDTDADGEANYIDSDFGSIDGNVFSIPSFEFADNSDLRLNSAAEGFPRYEYRLTVLNENFESQDGLEVILSSDVSGESSATFDEASRQYVGSVEQNDSTRILIPSFTVGDTIYSGSSVTISANFTPASLRVSFSGTSTFQSSYEIPASQSTIDIVISPRLIDSMDSDLEVVLKTNNFEINPNIYKVFYSNAINVEASAIAIRQISALNVVRGSDSNTDFVFPGTTLIEREDLALDAVTSSLSLNNTLLTLQPNTVLPPGYSYRYEIADVTDVIGGKEVNLGDNSATFEVKSTEDFQISDLRVDNDNFTTAGSPILVTNTAGVATSPSNFSRTVNVYLPLSIEALENFTLSRVSLVRNGLASTSSVNTIDIVVDGNVQFTTRLVDAVSTANNETITGSFSSFSSVRGTALPDGRYFSVGSGVSLSDSSTSSENSVTFEYAYNVPGGEIQTGNITLQVQ